MEVQIATMGQLLILLGSSVIFFLFGAREYKFSLRFIGRDFGTLQNKIKLCTSMNIRIPFLERVILPIALIAAT